ncbi:F-type conjugal transfer pilus assembly protein TraB [Entomohabitans teleogrylli]|uniref:F-type conjugal transfer pilus assembly protein TraB n=1 Tax=Entomohabitans teleogrylli TaxID=1384589 RepID=UPI00073D6160|nr:F-type conjugal transfer pilus assembly protein TraB [Entomohabitans teleogrylli]HDS6520105.1 conjugal transfer protein TraB [Klebsiella oxytoca]
MANFNTLIKRKQYIWLGLILVGGTAAIGGGMYLSELNLSSDEEAPVQGEPAPDMTGVVDSNFNAKVEQHATTEMQATAADLNKRFASLQGEVDLLSKARTADQIRIDQLSNENAAMQEQLKALGVKPAVTGGEPAPSPSSPPPGPEGEPAPVNYPPQSGGAVPPPTSFYPGIGTVPPPQVTYQPVPVPNQIQRKTFSYNKGKKGRELPYIPSGSFAKSILIEGADANASVTGNESTVPMQVRLIGHVEMPNSKTYDLTGCFVGLEAWGDVSSERAIVRTRNISCIKGDKTIDQPIAGHISFMGKNGVKGEVVMRNGKILGWAWGAGFVDGIGQGMERASQPSVGLGATASVGAGDVFKMGIGGGASKAAQTLSEYYIKRAEQYHPVIPIGAGNEVTVVFQDGFQLKTIEELEAEKNGQQQAQSQEQVAQPEAQQSGSNLNGFNTDEMLKKLGKLDPRQFSPGEASQEENQG